MRDQPKETSSTFLSRPVRLLQAGEVLPSPQDIKSPASPHFLFAEQKGGEGPTYTQGIDCVNAAFGRSEQGGKKDDGSHVLYDRGTLGMYAGLVGRNTTLESSNANYMHDG